MASANIVITTIGEAVSNRTLIPFIFILALYIITSVLWAICIESKKEKESVIISKDKTIRKLKKELRKKNG